MTDTKPRLTIEGEKDERASEATAGGGAANGGTGGKGGNPFSHAREATAAWLSSNFPGHENAVFGGICGLVVAVLVFAIGFLRTLFVLLCVLVGVAIGQYLVGNPTVVMAVRMFFGIGGE
ncbi:MAG: DUF2273 domain-containing protein [Parafannyhessea umbonata]|uniref:DUF2273 domain-containing protein n=1 Tax=Parafannyhessea umbonata TaxID=604330 RepID=UPI0026EDD99B|nr:DUF2273 domain-containing protein [Parafannyhessea umbonata]MDD6566951.1 DUF2273 domain-containing protein [Parafannyhessea umbonata]